MDREFSCVGAQQQALAAVRQLDDNVAVRTLVRNPHHRVIDATLAQLAAGGKGLPLAE